MPEIEKVEFEFPDEKEVKAEVVEEKEEPESEIEIVDEVNTKSSEPDVPSATEEELATELRAEHLRRAAEAIGRITGRIDVEDLLDVIFREFCIGK
jgi:tRNA U34 5-carboxymethylaminomethyl modifying GTPase MnmE/TrmE